MRTGGATVGEIVGGGFQLIRERIREVAVWSGLYLVMNVVVVMALRPLMAPALAAQASGQPANPALMMGNMGAMMGLYLVLLIGLLVLYTAALRAAVRPEESRFAYLRLGMDEVRVLVTALALWVAFFLIYMVSALVVGIVAGIFIAAAPRVAVFVALPLGLAMFALLLFFYIRFSLVFVLTMERRKIIIGESWNATKGRFWTLFLAYLVVALIIMVVAFGLMGMTMGPYFAQIARSGFNPQAMQAAQQQQLAQQYGAITLFTVVGWVLGSVLVGLWIAMSAGVSAAAARGAGSRAFANIAEVYA